MASPVFPLEEAYGDSNDPESFIGFGAVRLNQRLSPNPTLAAAYLQLAFVSVTNTLREAAATPNDSARDELNGLALFATAYLFPEVRSYLPGAEGAWSGLYRQALTGVSEPRRIAVEARLQSILEVRSRTMKYQSSEEYVNADAGEKSEVIDKLPDGCKRDQARAELAFDLAHTKKFSQARQAADEIDNLSLRENVVQFLNCDVALAAIEAGNLLEASSLAEKVTAKDQRALPLVKIAARSIKKGDQSVALDLLNRAQSLVSDSEPDLQSGALLAIANVYVRFDPLEAVMVLRGAIKALNRAKNPNIEPFSVFRRVDINCPGEGRWHGSRELADTSGLYEILAALTNSEVQPQEALLIASELENKSLRLRSQLSVVKAVNKDK
jgi:hypothetical protein